MFPIITYHLPYYRHLSLVTRHFFFYFCCMPDKITYPYRYHAYGLDILSQLPVTGFEPAEIRNADVTIRLADVPTSLPDAVNKGVLYQSTETEFLLQIDNVARFHVRNGHEIVVQLLGKSAPGDISAFISGTVLGALMHQRRMLPIHASTVVYKDKCLLFAGVSGSGKSTLATAVIGAGGSLVADDISVIDFSGDKPSVCPAFPMMRIWEDSLKHFGIPFRDFEPVREELRKFYMPVSRFHRTQTPIHQIFILGTHNKEAIEIKNLQGVDKFRVLKKHTYLFRGIPKTGLEQNHFMLVNRLAMQVPVTLITRPNDSFDTTRLMDILNETVTSG